MAEVRTTLKDKLDMSVFQLAWAKYDLPEDEAIELALEAQHTTRPQRC